MNSQPRELISYEAAAAFWKEGKLTGIGESILWRSLLIASGLWLSGDKGYLYHGLIASLTVESYVLYWAKRKLEQAHAI